MNARPIGTSKRILYSSIALFIALFITTVWHSLPVGALAIPHLVKAELPIATTPLDALVTPLTNTTNKLLPVQVTTTPSTLSAQVQLPTGGSERPVTPIVSAQLAAPIVPEVVNQVTGTTERPPSPSPPPANEAPSSTSSSSPPATAAGNATLTAATTPSSPPSARQTASAATTSSAQQPSLPFAPVLMGVANFLTRGLPGDVQTLSHSLSRQQFGFTPLLISVLLFFVVSATVIGTVYMMDRGVLSRIAGGRFAHIEASHDVTQIAALAIVLIGAAIVGGYLLLVR